MKVAICTPCHGDTRAGFTLSLASMLLTEAANHQFGMFMGFGSNLPKLRNELAQQALDWEPDYVLWLDSDHEFPPDTLNSLLARDVDIVGCNFRRRYGDQLTAYTNGREVQPAAGCEPVDSFGLGICLMRASVFDKAPKPWFVFGHLEDGSTTGEDQFFFARLYKAAGIRPHLDHDLSARVSHLALVPLTLGRGDDQLRLHPGPPSGDLV